MTQTKQEDSPVYEVKPESDKGRIRVLHRNLLLPCDFLQAQTEDVHTKPKKTKRISDRKKQREQECSSDEEEEEEQASITGPGITGHVQSRLRVEAPEFYPEDEATQAEGCNSVDGGEEELADAGSPEDGNEAADTEAEDESLHPVLQTKNYIYTS